MSLIGSEENPVEAKRRRKGRTKVADLEDDMEEGEGDGSNSWEEVRRGGRGDGEEEEREMHYLLPLKTRGGLVLQPAVPKPKGVHVTLEELVACILLHHCPFVWRSTYTCNSLLCSQTHFLAVMVAVVVQMRTAMVGRWRERQRSS